MACLFSLNNTKKNLFGKWYLFLENSIICASKSFWYIHQSMKKIFLIIILSFLIANYVEAAKQPIEIQPVEERLYLTEPRKILTTSFRITNNTNQKREFISGNTIHVFFCLIRIEGFYRRKKLFPAHGGHPFYNLMVEYSTIGGSLFWRCIHNRALDLHWPMDKGSQQKIGFNCSSMLKCW